MFPYSDNKRKDEGMIAYKEKYAYVHGVPIKFNVGIYCNFYRT